jgi:hypothetical protein
MAEYIIQGSTISSIGDAIKDRSRFIPSSTFGEVPNILRNNFNRPEEHYKCYGISGQLDNSTSVWFELDTFSEDGDNLTGEYPITLTAYVSSDADLDGTYTFYPSETVTADYYMSIDWYDGGHYPHYDDTSATYTIFKEGVGIDCIIHGSRAEFYTGVYVSPYIGGYEEGCEVNSYTCTLTPNSYTVSGDIKVGNPSYYVKFLAQDVDINTLSTIRTTPSIESSPISYSNVETSMGVLTITTNRLYNSGWFYVNYEKPKEFHYLNFRVMFDDGGPGTICAAKVAIPKNSAEPVICHPQVLGDSYAPEPLTAYAYGMENIGDTLTIHLVGEYFDAYGELVNIDRDFDCRYTSSSQYASEFLDIVNDDNRHFYEMSDTYMSYSDAN